MNCKLAKADLGTAERSTLLGHSVMTNEKYYTFAEHNLISISRDALNKLNKIG